MKIHGEEQLVSKPLESSDNFKNWGTSLVIQWLTLHASTAGGTGLIPGQGSKISHATRCGQIQINKIKNWCGICRHKIILKWTIQGHLLPLHYCATSTSIKYRTFSSLEKKILCPLSSALRFPLLPTLSAANPRGFTYSGYFTSGNPVTWGLLYLTSFTYHNVFEVHPRGSMYQHTIPFWWLTNIPPYL